MFSIKSEPSDDVGKDSQRVRLMDDNPHISDTLDVNTSGNWLEKSISKDISQNDKVGDAEHNTIKECDIHHVTDISQHYKVEDEERDTMHVKEESQNFRIKEHNIHHMTDISQHHRVGESDSIDMGDMYPSSVTKSRAKTHTRIQKRIQSREKRFKRPLCAYNTTQFGNLKAHKLLHSGEKPYKCDLCDFSTAQFGNLKRHALIHSGEKPYKCDLCDYNTTQFGNLKAHKLIHLGEKPYKCDLCDKALQRLEI